MDNCAADAAKAQSDPRLMDLLHLESLAIEFYFRLGFDPAEPTDTFTLAKRYWQLKGWRSEVITRPPSLLGDRPACLWWLRDEPSIALRRTVAIEIAQHMVGHELSHLILERPHDGTVMLERQCDYLGACLMAPRPAVARMFKAHGWKLRRIAQAVVATETWVSLRLGEALGFPLAAISPKLVRTRGPEDFVWPDEGTIREFARQPGPGLTKVRISDQPARIVLVAD
ncbi:MAG: ImmA/IrrE family metallo-endopeptidase [Polyangiaceae bacterium]|nr:ImmA/IrrE family metallo-endopeptidase [Polyangiaceae bacterium]